MAERSNTSNKVVFRRIYNQQKFQSRIHLECSQCCSSCTDRNKANISPCSTNCELDLMPIPIIVVSDSLALGANGSNMHAPIQQFNNEKDLPSQFNPILCIQPQRACQDQPFFLGEIYPENDKLMKWVTPLC